MRRKKHATILFAAVIALSTLAGCYSDYATFSSPYGSFVLFPNGTYTQTFLTPPAVSDNRGKGDDKGKDDLLAALPNSGSWRLIGPSDGPGNGGFQVELEGVRAGSSASLADGFTITVDAMNIRNFDRLLRKQKPKPESHTPPPGG